MSNDTRIAVDVAKAVFELAISDRPGHVARRARLPRALFLAFMAQQPAAVVVMEACGTAHHWAREIQKLGHRVVLLPPHHVRPYIRRNKTDRTDAKGILEASRNDDIGASLTVWQGMTRPQWPLQVRTNDARFGTRSPQPCSVTRSHRLRVRAHSTPNIRPTGDTTTMAYAAAVSALGACGMPSMA